MGDFKDMLERVRAAYRIVPEDYPVVSKISPEETYNFSISHTTKHISKALGKIAAQMEEADHGGVPDKEVLKKATYSMFISCFKLAEEQGISAKELYEELPKHI